MSKFVRPMTTNIGSTLFSNTIVTQYRPRTKFYANGIFYDKSSHTTIKLFRIKLTEQLKDVFPIYIANIKTFQHVVIEI